MTDTEAVPESSSLYPPDHDEFIRKLDAGHRPSDVRDNGDFIQRVKIEKEKREKEKEPDGDKPNGIKPNNDRV